MCSGFLAVRGLLASLLRALFSLVENTHLVANTLLPPPPPSIFLTLSEGDIHQPLIKLLDLPEVVDHFSGGRIVHVCEIQSCLQSQQLREKMETGLMSRGCSLA